MKIESIEHIKSRLSTIEEKEDFISLLNLIKKEEFGSDSYPFELRQLMYHSFPKLNQYRYLKFSIKKKSGGERIILAPNNGLKAIQQCLNTLFNCIYTPQNNIFGFVPQRSIVDNAKYHLGQNYIYNIDLKDFFPSIDQARVWKKLQLPPFNIKPQLANIIASLCCHEMEVERLDENGQTIILKKNVLPQGAPTSPTLTNIVCERLDRRLSGLAKKHSLRYSRYADDITFSSMHNVYQKDSVFTLELKKIITNQNFRINDKKTRLQKIGSRQEITGLIMSDRVNVTKHYIKQLRVWLHCWERDGYENLNNIFLSQYKMEKERPIKGELHMKNVIDGKLMYLSMVKGKENSTYVRLKNRFDKLCVNTEEIVNTSSKIDKKLNDFYNNGFNLNTL